MITTFAEVSRLAKEGNVVPVSLRLSADLDTPVSTFLKLAKGKKYSFLLESIEGGEKLARYSFVGFDPFLLIEIKPASDNVERKHGKGIREIFVRNGNKKEITHAQPIEFLETEFAKYSPAPSPGIPRFSGGAVGYFGYDAIRWIENIPSTTKDNLHIPDCILGFYRSIVVFDHLRQELILVANVLCDEGEGSLRAKYNTAREWLEKTRQKIDRNVKRQSAQSNRKTRKPALKTHLKTGEFEKIVRRAKKYIREGDIFQVVLSQRWSLKAKVDPTALYRQLRRMNPSPYMFLLNFDDVSVVGSSPEMLTRVEGDTVEARPIAGTRPRGKNPAEDEKLAGELLADPKERAEHIMLLDLGRNDVGKVSRAGTVEVTQTMEVEKYSHVMHLVSAVVGKRDPSVTSIEAMMSCFPAGTVSGAPKVRAMEIIDELESESRGVFAGAVAYLDFWGNLDSCIAIRTALKKGDCVYIQAGAGIVADSQPVRERKETESKVAALCQAIMDCAD